MSFKGRRRILVKLTPWSMHYLLWCKIVNELKDITPRSYRNKLFRIMMKWKRHDNLYTHKLKE